jgi:hypothetical protein
LPVSCAQLHQYSPNLVEWNARDFRKNVSPNVIGTLVATPACCGAISAKAPIEYQADDDGVTPASSSRHRERLLASEDETSE